MRGHRQLVTGDKMTTTRRLPKPPGPAPLERILSALAEYLQLEDERHYLAMALWITHTFVFEQ